MEESETPPPEPVFLTPNLLKKYLPEQSVTCLFCLTAMNVGEVLPGGGGDVPVGCPECMLSCVVGIETDLPEQMEAHFGSHINEMELLYASTRDGGSVVCGAVPGGTVRRLSGAESGSRLARAISARIRYGEQWLLRDAVERASIVPLLHCCLDLHTYGTLPGNVELKCVVCKMLLCASDVLVSSDALACPHCYMPFIVTVGRDTDRLRWISGMDGVFPPTLTYVGIHEPECLMSLDIIPRNSSTPAVELYKRSVSSNTAIISHLRQRISNYDPIPLPIPLPIPRVSVRCHFDGPGVNW